MFADLIMNYVQKQTLDQVSKKIGIDPWVLAKGWWEEAIWSLLTGLFHNTQKEEWLTALTTAVTKDHDWSIFDDVTALLTKGEKWKKIVWHILGDKQDLIAGFLAKKLGVSETQATSLLNFVAPLVMWALGKVKQQTQSDAPWLKTIIAEEEQEFAKKSTTPTIILKLFDKDGDGDVDLSDFLA